MDDHAASQQELAGLIIDDRRDARFKVNRHVFVDDEILALERKRVFAKCWLYLGHVSEVPAAGSFVSRRVGGRPLLFTRDRDGKLNALYNTCAHRGALVCRERAGNRRAFTCGYHALDVRRARPLHRHAGPRGAAARRDRRLQARSRPRRAHGGISRLRLRLLDRAAEPLVDYLAGAAAYLGYVADQGAEGMEIVTGSQDYCVAANWKLLQENSVDGYHGVPTHGTYFDYLRSRDEFELHRRQHEIPRAG